MRIVFMGTPDFAATILEDLLEHHEVGGVFTRPDAVRGRGKAMQASPVALMAGTYDIPVYKPSSFKDAKTRAQLKALAPDVVCVAAYGMILPQDVLDIPPYGCLNVHGSLLPRWRGAAPIERAILGGDKETGVCVMRMEEGMDTGDYCVCRTTVVGEKTASELSDELANLGSYALLTALVHCEQDALDWTRQDEALVTYADKIAKHELNISPADSAREVRLKVQASSGAHPSRCVVATRPLTVIRARNIAEDEQAQELVAGLGAGDVCFVQKRLFLGARDGAVEVLHVKPDGKPEMDAKSFCAGIQGIKEGSLRWEALQTDPEPAQAPSRVPSHGKGA
ncbi:MAG: methionyl-tRNA formyltransferase [Eggerthellaceae bacterium]|nr:methionyl-tRNA formyltransferase [Eggerthellaceae bacterium]